jgi:tetratricopeptide (TPR) repeat protein
VNTALAILLVAGAHVAVVAQGLAAAPGLSPADNDAAWKRCRGNDPDVRIEACRALIDSRPELPADLASAYYSRGTAYRQKGRFTEAVDDFNAAINANPTLIDAYGERGITFTILGRFNDAIPDFSRVIEAYPRLAYPYYNRGLCYELIGLDDLAIEDITKSIEIEPRADFRYERRGTIYFRKKLIDQALADYEQALVINPQYAPALYARGIVKMKKGDLAGGGADIAAAKYIRDTIDLEMSRAGVK